jgi:Fe-S cluster assembly protein SufD
MTVDTAIAAESPLTAALERADEPDWLRALRARWWERAEATPWPTGQEEEWRRTSLDKLPRDGELVTEASSMRCAIDPRLVEAGVVFSDLPTAVREHPDLVGPYLGMVESVPVHAKPWALSLAAWTGGTFLYVPAGVTVDGTLTARIGHERRNATFLPHSLIVAERGAAVTLLEDYSSPDGTPGWFGGTVDIRAGAESRVRYANLQRLGDATWNVGAQRVEVGQDASVTSLNAEVGSKVTKLGLDIRMVGKGGTSRLLGLLAAGDDQHIDIDTVQDLLASYTTSDLLYLSALYDQARAAFYGRTKVRPQAKQTSSYQECRNLLLSPNAGAEPIPVLEIETNDILRCGHGATAGAIDPTQLFYAQTRGLDADEAERMIVRGFFEQVVAQIHDETIREWVLKALAARIGTSEAFETDPAVAA